MLTVSLLLVAMALILGMSHAVEPDHVVAMRLMKGVRDYVIFGLFHWVGFAIISVPLVVLISSIRILELVGYAIGIAFSLMLLVGELLGREIEFGGGASVGSGIAQGALAITPSKVLIAVLAAETGLVMGFMYIALFIVSSSLFMIMVGVLLHRLDKALLRYDISKYMNIAIAVVALLIIVLQLIHCITI